MREGKTIVITGTSRGIGYHLSKRFLELGYHVLGISRSPTPLQHGNFRQVYADLGTLDGVNGLQGHIENTRVCGLINNAAIHGPIGSFEANNFSDWIKAFQVNLFSAAALAQMCIPRLRKEHGFIIFLSGGGAGFGRPNFSAYGVSKTAVVRLSEVLAKELAPDVFVYCMAPGPTRTQLLEEAIEGGEAVPPQDIVDFSSPLNLCEFLSRNTDPRYSGKFIHVKDDYQNWGAEQLAADAYTLRRVKP